ncbi:Fc.00g002930.m01.CDS01 [Cosmosporella sp. VM-42]
MSTQAPHVLSRRPNGAPASQSNESGKGETTHRRSGRGRGSHEKSNEASHKKSSESETPKPSKSKAHNEGEKLVIRRLPPGMTEAEFSSILGADWETGKGKVDWFEYVAGKVSNDASKPSRPSRAYVHVTKKDHILALSDAVRTSKWEDAQATFNNPSLAAPPCVEIAIYKKVPSGKKRADARQGTIDQDPEFMAFLEDLANPAPPNQNIEDDADDAAKAESKVTTTPLIEYLKEKKANKAKEAAAAKSAKHARQESGTKGKGSKDDEPTKKKGRDSKAERAEKGPKETVKILTKKAAAEQAAEAAKVAANQIKSEKDQEGLKTSRRAGIAAAARILQRDLGLSPGSAHRKARQDAAKADGDPKTPSTKEATAATTDRPASPAQSTDAAPQTSKNRPTTPTAPKAQSSGRRNRGGKNSEKSKAAAGATSSEHPALPAAPVVLLKKKAADTEPTPPVVTGTASQTSKDGSASKAAPSGPKSKSGSSQKKPPTVTPDATRGFVKHANPSQGVTEALLKQALEVYGTITFVEIDKRKGFAYVDFSEHASLVKAVSASPVPVAQGTVQVLERKDKKPATTAPASGASGSAPAPEKPSGRGRRGRGGGNKGNAVASNQQAAPAAAAPATTNGG